MRASKGGAKRKKDRTYHKPQELVMIALFNRAASAGSNAYPLSDGAEEMQQITKIFPASKDRHSDAVMDLWMMNG